MPTRSEFPAVAIATEPLHETWLARIWQHSTREPDAVAFVSAEDPTRRTTYRELYVKVHSLAAFLARRGFQRGDVVCLVRLVRRGTVEIERIGDAELPGVRDHIPRGQSLRWRVERRIRPLHGLYLVDFGHFNNVRVDELERQFVDSHCSVVVTAEAQLERVISAAKRSPLVTTVVCITDLPDDKLPFGVVGWRRAISEQPAFTKCTRAEIDIHNDVVLLPYSRHSGTTGSPKGVMLTHRNFSTMMNAVLSHLNDVILPKVVPDGKFNWTEEHFLLFLPFYHIYGMGMLMSCLYNGCTAIVFRAFDPTLFLKSIQTYRIKMLYLVPPVLLMLAKSPAVDQFDLSSLVFVLSGAAPAGEDLCKEFMSRHKSVRFLTQAYGMTECGMVSHFPTLMHDPVGSAGRLVATFEQKVIDLATGEELPPGERGEVCVRGPTVMKGYLGRPAATAEAIDKDGWLHTGDIGRLDEQGNMFVVDRLKELIKVKGLQVPPAELEDLLLSHPQIRDAAVVGVPDGKNGELPRAYVVRADDTLTETAVQEFVAGKVSPYKHLKGGVEFLQEIPKSAAGKILRRLLRERAKSTTAKL